MYLISARYGKVIWIPTFAAQRLMDSKVTEVRWTQTLTWEIRQTTIQTETDSFARLGRISRLEAP